MGEKDVTPAGPGAPGGLKTPAPTAPGGGAPAKQAGGGHTTEKPNTGATDTGDSQKTPPPPAPARGRSEMSDLFDDGYRASRDTQGVTTLTDPGGTTATWNPDSNTWVGADGNPMPPDWGDAHDPRDYTPGVSN